MNASRRPERYTGLNSYHLIVGGQFVYGLGPLRSGGDREQAKSWLWTPEQVDSTLAEMARLEPKLAGALAVRARQ